jgi:hypothetical protein
VGAAAGTLDFPEKQIESAEKLLEAIMEVSVEAELLKTPCVGKILKSSQISGERRAIYR